MARFERYMSEVLGALTPTCDHDPENWGEATSPCVSGGILYLGGRIPCLVCPEYRDELAERRQRKVWK